VVAAGVRGRNQVPRFDSGPYAPAKYKRMDSGGIECYTNEYTKEFPELNGAEVSAYQEEEDEDEVAGGPRVAAAAPAPGPAASADFDARRASGCSSGRAGQILLIKARGKRLVPPCTRGSVSLSLSRHILLATS